ncbi:MAG: DUF3575 domain-containing protein [Tannerellaceae bacterium]|nr:DUF3575 domain-containing protein [Tannerellaceae bacterium]
MKSGRFPLIIILNLTVWPVIHCQELNVQSNLLYWATATPNLTVEYAVSGRVSLALHGGYNPWLLSSREENKKLQHWVVQPEVRLWNCEPFIGGFWGLHAHYGRYNMGGVDLPFGFLPTLKEHRYEGWFTGAGISYGYQWYLSPRWNLQATIGVGYAYSKYKKYECRRCGDFIKSDHKHYVGPTQLGVSLIYLIKTKK